MFIEAAPRSSTLLVKINASNQPRLGGVPHDVTDLGLFARSPALLFRGGTHTLFPKWYPCFSRADLSLASTPHSGHVSGGIRHSLPPLDSKRESQLSLFLIYVQFIWVAIDQPVSARRVRFQCRCLSRQIGEASGPPVGIHGQNEQRMSMRWRIGQGLPEARVPSAVRRAFQIFVRNARTPIG